MNTRLAQLKLTAKDAVLVLTVLSVGTVAFIAVSPFILWARLKRWYYERKKD